MFNTVVEIVLLLLVLIIRIMIIIRAVCDNRVVKDGY